MIKNLGLHRPVYSEDFGQGYILFRLFSIFGYKFEYGIKYYSSLGELLNDKIMSDEKTW